MLNFIELEKRLFEELRVNKSVKVYELMGVTSARYANWKARNSIPYEDIISLCENQNINLIYILTGKKDKITINYKEKNLEIIETATEEEQKNIYYSIKLNTKI